MPMRLDEGWNQIQFNLSDFTRRAYGTNYIETLRYVHRRRFGAFAAVQHGRCRLAKPLAAFGTFTNLLTMLTSV